jgi:hypothetical protein
MLLRVLAPLLAWEACVQAQEEADGPATVNLSDGSVCVTLSNTLKSVQFTCPDGLQVCGVHFGSYMDATKCDLLPEPFQFNGMTCSSEDLQNIVGQRCFGLDHCKLALHDFAPCFEAEYQHRLIVHFPACRECPHIRLEHGFPRSLTKFSAAFALRADWGGGSLALSFGSPGGSASGVLQHGQESSVTAEVELMDVLFGKVVTGARSVL